MMNGRWLVPYVTLLPKAARWRAHGLCEVFNGLRHVLKTGALGAGVAVSEVRSLKAHVTSQASGFYVLSTETSCRNVNETC